MNDGEGTRAPATRARRALWASTLFYAVIAFEFFYMASPFGAYLYALYGPGLDSLQAFGATGWTIRFFLPHIVAETRSVLVDSLGPAGMILFGGGLAGFAVGAFQVYRAKLRGGGAVTGGLYRYIRHPQYLALIVASIGMALVWPRYLVVVATVTVVFIYVALAKLEEGICLRQFPGYAAYVRQTGMFLPAFLVPGALPVGTPRWARGLVWAGFGFAVLGVALGGAIGLRAHALDSLYALRTNDDIYLSVTEIDDEELATVAGLARSSSAAEVALAGRGPLLNYVLPVEMHVSEIPMRLPPGATFTHSIPTERDRGRYKVVFTEAVFDANGPPEDGDTLAHAVNKVPLIEVHVDLGKQVVTSTFPPPDQPFYGHRQVPVF